MLKEGKEGYFEAALSDFAFDVAAGGAIRHLVDRGYSVGQIVKELDYPVPRARVEKAVYKYLTENGILVSELPIEESVKNMLRVHEMNSMNANEGNNFAGQLYRYIEKNGVENSYLECPFGIWKKDNTKRLEAALACLSAREQDYIQEILWEPRIMYYRLTDRMQEISRKLVKTLPNYPEEEWKFYFLKTKEMICVRAIS